MRELEPALFKLGPQCGIGGRQQEKDEGRGHHVMREAWNGGLLAADAAADPGVALQHQDLAALAGEEGGGHERIDAAAGDHIIRHGRSPLPLP